MNFVDRIFVGELTNTIMCEECEHVSVCGRTIAKDLNIQCEPTRQSSLWCLQQKNEAQQGRQIHTFFSQPYIQTAVAFDNMNEYITQLNFV